MGVQNHEYECESGAAASQMERAARPDSIRPKCSYTGSTIERAPANRPRDAIPAQSCDVARDGECGARNERRSRVYDDLMRKWQQALSSTGPKPRSSHARVLGGEALTTRQRAESMSSVDKAGVHQSWGNPSDIMSSAAQSAWREQLLRRKLSRLAGVPMNVLLRHGIRSDNGGGCKVITAAPYLSAELTARAVIEGTCLAVAGPVSSPRAAAANLETVEEGSWPGGQAVVAAIEKESTGALMRHRGKEEVEGTPSLKPLSMENVNAHVARGSSASTASLAAAPKRGFHLVDLHALVRNCVEWSHILPKVEPCFRVGDNRDGVLLGLVHALGGRLSCSSVHDIQAGRRAARRVSPTPAPPPRMLDRHVCRSPVLLRAAVKAGVRLFEVDCADELRRIQAARRKAERTAETPTATEVLIRLAMPVTPTWQVHGNSQVPPDEDLPTFSASSDAIFAEYGAKAEDVPDLVQASTLSTETSRHSDDTGPASGEATDVTSGRSVSNRPLQVVGFSIDVGAACSEDARAAASTPVRDVLVPAPTADLTLGETVPSPPLVDHIDAAIALAVEAGRLAAEAAAAVVASETGSEFTGANVVASRRSTKAGAATAPPFSFRRLHITGLGEGGARSEPLTALKAALSRRLPTVGSPENLAAGAAGRAIVVSADATDHLIAGGVWSTVASIIGRKGLSSSDADVTALSTPKCEIGDNGSGGAAGTRDDTCSKMESSDSARKGGAMYYIDDGCYGSLSGALLRGVQMQPSPLRLPSQGVVTNRTSLGGGLTGSTKDCTSKAVTAKPNVEAAAMIRLGENVDVSCTVWGPTCDGLDCVSRVTQLPSDMEPGRDWLFFPDMGARAGADATNFNGLKPLDSFYCIRQRDDGTATTTASLSPYIQS